MLIKNIRIVDAIQDFTGDILVEDGKIKEIGQHLPAEEELYFDFTGQELVLLPAFTDLHVHFRDPGFTYKEDVISGSKAAVKGGYTFVNLMPNTNPVCSTLTQKQDVENRVKAIGLIEAHQTLSITKDLKGNDYQHLKSLKKREVLFITNDGKGVEEEQVMDEIFQLCKEKEIGIMLHEEDCKYSATDMRTAENNMTLRDLALCEKRNGTVHFSHVSTIEAIEAITQAKKKGLAITCEVTPHHIFATGEAFNHYRVNPPLRNQNDIDSIINAIQTGIVDAISTDHAPHTQEDKQNGAPGLVGLETAFGLCYTALVKNDKITLNHLVKLMSETPSQMLKLNKGKIAVGQDADFVLIDLNNPYKIDVNTFVSKGKNSPFDGVEVYGKMVATFFRGKKVY
ncbi:MAG: dihydroorotase [Bacteroidales bacterium]|jgi:dihydroorotase|nr:dihydroorotase [Bacteroidales bacterium]